MPQHFIQWMMFFCLCAPPKKQWMSVLVWGLGTVRITLWALYSFCTLLWKHRPFWWKIIHQLDCSCDLLFYYGQKDSVCAVRSPQRRRACCEFGSKSACILWFFATCASKLWFCDKIARLLWFLQHQLCFLDFFTAQLINEITYFPPCPLDPLFMVSWLFYVSMHIGRVENVSMMTMTILLSSSNATVWEEPLPVARGRANRGKDKYFLGKTNWISLQFFFSCFWIFWLLKSVKN